MKIYLLDLGSLVIDRSDVLWHIDVGTPVRFPDPVRRAWYHLRPRRR